MRALILAALIAASGPAFGQSITNLPAGAPPYTGSEVLPGVQGAATVKMKLSDVAASGVVVGTAQTLPYTLGTQATDVGGNVPFTGTGNFVVNSGVIPFGKGACYENQNALGGGNATITGTATIHGLPSTTVRPLGGGCLFARQDGSYDWFPGLPGGDPAMLGLADQTLSGGVNLTVTALSTGSFTADCGKNPGQWIANTGAFTITAPANDGQCVIQIENGAGAATPGLSGFSVGSNTGDAFDTTNGHKFQVWISRIHGVATYRVAALQ